MITRLGYGALAKHLCHHRIMFTLVKKNRINCKLSEHCAFCNCLLSNVRSSTQVDDRAITLQPSLVLCRKTFQWVMIRAKNRRFAPSNVNLAFILVSDSEIVLTTHPIFVVIIFERRVFPTDVVPNHVIHILETCCHQRLEVECAPKEKVGTECT